MNDKLKPVRCGCGGEAEIFHIAPEGYAGSYCVRCVECLTQTPFFTGNKEKAIETWNNAMSGISQYPCTNTNDYTITNTTDPLEDFHPIYDYMIGKEWTATAKVIEHDASITDTDGYKYHRSEYLCGACKKKVIGGDEYCSHCGVRLEWN